MSVCVSALILQSVTVKLRLFQVDKISSTCHSGFRPYTTQRYERSCEIGLQSWSTCRLMSNNVVNRIAPEEQYETIEQQQ